MGSVPSPLPPSSFLLLSPAPRHGRLLPALRRRAASSAPSPLQWGSPGAGRARAGSVRPAAASRLRCTGPPRLPPHAAWHRAGRRTGAPRLTPRRRWRRWLPPPCALRAAAPPCWGGAGPGPVRGASPLQAACARMNAAIARLVAIAKVVPGGHETVGLIADQLNQIADADPLLEAFGRDAAFAAARDGMAAVDREHFEAQRAVDWTALE